MAGERERLTENKTNFKELKKSQRGVTNNGRDRVSNGWREKKR